MLTDYKIASIRQQVDDSWIVVFRIYEGDITTEVEEDPDLGMVPVTRYRRTALLSEERRRFDPMPEAALNGRLRAELRKDRTRTAIPEQAHD
jgi:hypothetical protein